jgi:hypothetical protein
MRGDELNSHKDHSIEEQRRATWRKIAPTHELGAETDGAAVKSARAIGGVRVDPKRLNTSSESARSSERGALVSYFRDIAEIPTLGKEEEVLLAKEIEAATLAFREGIVRVPWTSVEAVRIWRTLKAENRATGAFIVIDELDTTGSGQYGLNGRLQAFRPAGSRYSIFREGQWGRSICRTIRVP